MLNKSSWLKKQKEDELAKEREHIETSKIYAEYVKEFEASVETSSTQTYNSPKSDSINTKQSTTPGCNDVISSVFGPEGAETTPEDIHNPYVKEYLKSLKPSLSEPPSRVSTHGKTREIDAFIKELKEKQQRQEEEKARGNRLKSPVVAVVASGFSRQHGHVSEGRTDSADATNDPITLCVDNLYGRVTEDDLHRHFSCFGPIKDIKICRKTASGHQSSNPYGLVTFSDHDTALRAKDCLDGTDILGHRCRIYWEHSHIVGSSQVSSSSFSHGSDGPSTTAPSPPLLLINKNGVNVELPKSQAKREVIDLMARYVAAAGADFEELIITNELPDGLFDFLFDRRSPDHVYYRWKVYSLLQGECHSDKPFHIVDGGIKWNPPTNVTNNAPQLHGNINTFPGSSAPGSDIAISLQAKGRTPILESDLNRLHDLLRNCSTTRGYIAEAMMFIINHGESAYQVTDILIRSILDDTATVENKISRLYILSDVLYNSSASHQFAWLYRLSLETRIPEVFYHLRKFIESSTSKIAKKRLTDSAMSVLWAWQQWTVYTPDYIRGLESTLLGSGLSSIEESSHFKENSHLLDKDHDGQEVEYFEMLSKLPMKWREPAYAYLTLTLKKLKQLCTNRGLFTLPGTRLTLVTRLIADDIYWEHKEMEKENTTSNTFEAETSDDNMETECSIPVDKSEIEEEAQPTTELTMIDSSIIRDECSDMESASSMDLPAEADDIIQEAVPPTAEAITEDTTNASQDTAVSTDVPPSQPVAVEDDIDDMFATEN